MDDTDAVYAAAKDAAGRAQTYTVGYAVAVARLDPVAGAERTVQK